MATIQQLEQAEAEFERANDALNDARTAVIRAERQFNLAREAGPDVDPDRLALVTRNLDTARSNFQAADAAYTAAQQNFQVVYDAVDDTAARQADPVVAQAEAEALPEDPPLNAVQFQPDPVEIDSAGLAVTDEDLFEQDNPREQDVGDDTGYVDPDFVAGDEETALATPESQELGDLAGYGPQGEINLDTEPLVPRAQGDGNITGYGEEDEEASDELVRARNESTTIDSQRYQVRFDASDVANGPYYIEDVSTGEIAVGGFQSELAAQTDANLLNSPDPTVPDQSEAETARLQEANAAAAEQEATLAAARAQQALKNQQRQINLADWRVRLTLAEGADYLYMDPGAGQQSILYPLKVSNGVIFPYTPQISTSYRANYDAYNLVHSNFKGYFYQSSSVEPVSIVATFTAQDTNEANYILAVIHFFRSVTKMFYGANDPLRGTPPPLVFLRGLGQYQFNNHPCLVSYFSYNLPNDVDYIRAGSANTAGLQNLNYRRNRASLPSNVFSGAVERLKNAGLPPGAEGNTTNRLNLPDQIISQVPTFGMDNPTYVPTKIEIELELLPVQSRQQVSQEFNMGDFASGKLITRGFW